MNTVSVADQRGLELLQEQPQAESDSGSDTQRDEGENHIPDQLVMTPLVWDLSVIGLFTVLPIIALASLIYLLLRLTRSS